jgi:hypothetical protein
MKRTILTISLFIVATSPLAGAETLRTFSWSELKQQGTLPAGCTILPATADVPVEQLQVENAGGDAVTVELLGFDAPGITQDAYAIRGYVRSRDVEGDAYLEMWNHMGGGGKFYSRSLAEAGPMARLTGTSGRRLFVVPAYLADRTDRPVRLTLSVVLPGEGTVALDSLELVEFGPHEDPLAVSQGGWWGERQAGIIGAVLGASFGLLGAIVGILGSRRSLHRVALGIMGVAAAAGVAMMAVGGAAMVMSQPRAVWYPLLLGGVIGTAVFGGLIPVVRRRRQQDEMRRMQAMDAS